MEIIHVTAPYYPHLMALELDHQPLGNKARDTLETLGAQDTQRTVK